MSLTLKASVNKVNLCWELGSVIRKRQENNEGFHWESRHIVLTVDDHGAWLFVGSHGKIVLLLSLFPL